MKWTPQDAIRFHNWEIDMSHWKACKRYDNEDPPPAKPANYDLWKAGPDPLKLDEAASTHCDGGSLVPPDWTSDAKPAPLKSPVLKQTDFLDL